MATYTATSGALTNTAVNLPARHRNGLIIGNPSDTAMTFAVGATASATVGVPIPAGGSIALLGHLAAPDQEVSLFCAGASKAYTLYEW